MENNIHCLEMLSFPWETLSEEGTSALLKEKVICMANEALDQGGLLTQEDLAILICSSRRTIRRDAKELMKIDLTRKTRGWARSKSVWLPCLSPMQ